MLSFKTLLSVGAAPFPHYLCACNIYKQRLCRALNCLCKSATRETCHKSMGLLCLRCELMSTSQDLNNKVFGDYVIE